MAISSKSIKLLWSNAAGRCAFPECRIRLCSDGSGASAPHTIGEMAHIRGEKPGSSRHDSSQTQEERDDYSNLILLCPTHHTLIDKPENLPIYSVAELARLKSDHERYVDGRLVEVIFLDKFEVARHIYPMMVENYTVFCQYGPHSEIARKNPSSAAHQIWLSERLSTITPNNRRMRHILERNLHLFAAADWSALTAFIVHSRGYEGWVSEEHNYEGIPQFPQEFQNLIFGLIK